MRQQKDEEEDARIYPCDRCGVMRSKAEGGTVFTVCDDCWNILQPPVSAEGWRSCPLLTEDDTPSNSYIAGCGTRFDTYEEMAAHNRKHTLPHPPTPSCANK